MHEVIDASVGDGLKELLDERALASDHLAEADLAALRAAMDEARARRLQPHYIELAFKAAFTRLGGRIVEARARAATRSPTCPPHIRASKHGPDRHQVRPGHLRPAARSNPRTSSAPTCSRRVTRSTTR